MVFQVKRRGLLSTLTLIVWLLAEVAEEFGTVAEEMIWTDPLDGNEFQMNVTWLHHPRKPFLMLDYRCKVVEGAKIRVE